MRVERRRVVLHIPQDLRWDLIELRERADDLGFSLSGETFAHWLIRFLREWCRRERKRLARMEAKMIRRVETEAYEDDRRWEEWKRESEV
jgi:hypothetical protein